MYSKKIFPTSCMGFSKKEVLDYIYEQDKLAEENQKKLELEIEKLKNEIVEIKTSSLAPEKAQNFKLILNQLKNTNNKFREELRLEKSRVKIYEEKISEQEKRIMVLCDKLREMEKKDEMINKLKNRIECLQSEICNEKAEIDKKDDKIQLLTEKNSELTHFLQQIQNKLSNLQNYAKDSR